MRNETTTNLPDFLSRFCLLKQNPYLKKTKLDLSYIWGKRKPPDVNLWRSASEEYHHFRQKEKTQTLILSVLLQKCITIHFWAKKQNKQTNKQNNPDLNPYCSASEEYHH